MQFDCSDGIHMSAEVVWASIDVSRSVLRNNHAWLHYGFKSVQHGQHLACGLHALTHQIKVVAVTWNLQLYHFLIYVIFSILFVIENVHTLNFLINDQKYLKPILSHSGSVSTFFLKKSKITCLELKLLITERMCL